MPMRSDVNFDAVQRLYSAGKTDREIGEYLGCAPTTCSKWRQRKGLKKKKKKQVHTRTEIGRIAPGMRADLNRFGDDLKINATWIGGRIYR